MTKRLNAKRFWAGILLISFLLQFVYFSHAFAGDDSTTKTVTATVNDEPSYTKLRQIDIGTFNEYRYRLTEQYFALRSKYNIDGEIDTDIATTMAELATKWYNYLPNNLNNKNRYNDLITEIQKGIKYPNSDANYNSLVKALQNYLESVDIKSVTGTVEATPKEGNAPLTVTLRAKVTDPTGTQIPNYNYIWRIDEGGKRVIIGTRISINYTFRDEGNYSVFLDVVSSHKNESWYTDVLPFSSRADIQVDEKVASMILKVNGVTLGNQDTIKFTPNEGSYGLIFDATSSTPTSGTKFIRTEWDFGNGVKRIYNGAPRVERVIYATEWEYTVTLKLTTNELKSVERQFSVSVHNPIATIQSSADEGYIGDKITFRARPSGKDTDLTYSWEVIDIDKDQSIFKKDGTYVDYTFTGKGKFNVKLTVTQPSGDVDTDAKIIYINSRSPVAEFTTKIQKTNRPNTIVFDASKSYDPDYTDDGNLKYNWIVDGVRVVLENTNYNGSVGTYTFNSVWDHSVALEVTDPDGITATKKLKVNVASILSVNLDPFPRVTQRNQSVRLEADSKEATFYEWDFGDGNKTGSKEGFISHTYSKSGIFDAKVTVRDADGNVNIDTKKVYVGNSDSPVAMINISKWSAEEPVFDKTACDGVGAYIVDRVTAIRFDSSESINIDGQKQGLTFSWKIGQDKFSTAQSLTNTFDELGCFPVKLTVKSSQNGSTDAMQTMVRVDNVAPTLSSLQITVADSTTDPVVVNVSALGAKDPDGVIQNYLWYYYTDTDNDPQDFRATTQPKTTFVLPKVTGNYYFVLVMKDNNDVKINSEEIAWQRYSITLAGDNVNTPIIDLKVNDSSVSVGDPVVFTAVAKNILWQDIGDKAEYYWDFDGDGFYDKQTKENSITYMYQKAGEFFPKVKVKNKGFSNVRNVQVDVVNKLVADFDYISIGNTFVFLNTSEWVSDSITWNFWDGNRIEGKDTVKYTFKDQSPDKNVTLTITDGTKVKTITKKVIADFSNVLKARKAGLNVFTSPVFDDKNTIALEKQTDKVYVYLWESKWDITKYGIDFDTNIDSDLNGWKDDDEDNKWTPSYTSWDPVEIKLNDSKTQTIRVFIKDASGIVLDSQDIQIVKNYIVDTWIDPNSVKFTSLSDENKAKIEKVKTFIASLDEPKKSEWGKLLAKLQDDWLDETERTKTILDLESFLGASDIKWGSAMIDILEGLLVSGQDDKSQKNIAFNALKWLLPDILTCTIPSWSGSDCKGYIVSQLEAIRDGNNLEQNKKMGTDILNVLKDAVGMTDSEKLDFKAVLKTFIYGGVDNIPQDEKKEVTSATSSQTSSGGIVNTILWFLWYIFLGLAILIGIFVIAALFFWVYFKLANKDEDMWFQDFIIKKTWGHWKESEKSNETTKDTSIIDVLAETKSVEDKIPEHQEEQKQAEEKLVANESTPATNDIPDWLKWASDFSQQTTESSVSQEPVHEVTPQGEVPQEEIKEEVPTISWEPTVSTWNNDWLITTSPEKEEIPSTEENSLWTDSATPTIPDWLKGSMEEEQTSWNQETPVKEEVSQEEQKVSEIPLETSIPTTQSEEITVPDWLKWSFEDTPSEEPVSSDEVSLPNSSEEEDGEEEVEVQWDTSNTSQDAAKKRKRRRKKKVSPSEESTQAESSGNISLPNDQTQTPSEEGWLWQDGMKIPDWLQDNSQNPNGQK